MSFGLINIARRNVGVRLGLWYAFIFACSSVALLWIAYYLLVATIGDKDRELVQARLREYATIYRAGGASMRRPACAARGAGEPDFYSASANVWNDVVGPANVPDDWVTFHDVPADWRVIAGAWA